MGKPIERRWTDIFDPTKTRTAKSDAVFAELSRFNVGLTKPRQKPNEPARDYRDRVRATGQRVYEELRGLIESDFYRYSDKSERRKILVDEIRKIKAADSREATGRYEDFEE
jgi:hypothetical protein